MGQVCPKCGYQRVSTDTLPAYECPKCGAVYAKVIAGATGVPKTLDAGTSEANLSDEEKIELIKERSRLDRKKKLIAQAKEARSQAPAAKGWTRKEWVVAVFSLFMLMVLLEIKGTDAPGEASPTTAFVLCRDEVRKRLLAPSTASFPHMGQAEITRTAGNARSFIISSYVDAQNAFGATIRNNWVCVIEHEQGDTWIVRHVDIH